MRYLIMSLFIAITCANSTAQVIDYEIDESFNTGSDMTKGEITDIVHTSDNNFLVIGWFHEILAPITRGALYGQNGELLNPMNGSVQWAKEYRNNYLAYGYRLGRFTENGWNYPNFKFEFEKSPYSNMVPQQAKAFGIKIMENDQILVAGKFNTDSTSPNYTAMRHLCLIDSTGFPVPGFPMVHCAQPLFESEIWTINLLNSGKYIIAGRFDEVNGYDYQNIARLNADFSVDTTFANLFTSQGIFAVQLIDSHERLWVGCSGGGTLKSNPDSVFNTIRILSSGEIDETFSMPTLHTLVGENEDILYEMSPYQIVEDDDNTFILGGNFVYANGEYHKTLMKIRNDGSIVSGAFSNLGADSAVWGDWIPPTGHIVGTEINKILKLPDGALLIGGRFSSFGEQPYNCIVKLKPNGFVGLENKIQNEELIVYPNPTRDIINIQLPLESQRIERILIYDSRGVMVKKKDINAVQSQIDISDLDNGFYVIESHSEKSVYSQKVIKY